MARATVTPVTFGAYESDIKDTWLAGYLEWAFDAVSQWIDRNIEAGNEEFLELAEIDWHGAREQMYANDVHKFETDDAVTIVGLIDDGSLIGGIYVDLLNDSIAKLNRLWIPDAYQGHGFGKELSERAVGIADAHDVDLIRLSTGPFMERAQSIYRDLGFEYRETPYPSSTAPEPLHPHWNFMELEL
ncbi:MAG: GNAT family N-acetyltransferase [Halobacteriales archaeon]|nr:GNAT family N-acetyltransferase [Halobacteriales archaeon]